MIWIGRRAFFLVWKEVRDNRRRKNVVFFCNEGHKWSNFVTNGNRRRKNGWFFCVASTTGHKLMLRASRHYFSKAQINKNPYGWCVTLWRQQNGRSVMQSSEGLSVYRKSMRLFCRNVLWNAPALESEARIYVKTLRFIRWCVTVVCFTLLNFSYIWCSLIKILWVSNH